MIVRRAAADEVIDLRHQVLRAGLPRETAIFPADEDASAIHVIAVDDGRTIGCATLHLNQWQGTPAYQLRGMAIAPLHQRRGIGSMLLHALEEAVREMAVRQLWCNA